MRAGGVALSAELREGPPAGGAAGLPFFTLNRSQANLEIFAALNLTV